MDKQEAIETINKFSFDYDGGYIYTDIGLLKYQGSTWNISHGRERETDQTETEG
jgi:hypothetical protein